MATKQFISLTPAESMQAYLHEVANTTASLDFIVAKLLSVGYTKNQISDGIKYFIDSTDEDDYNVSP